MILWCYDDNTNGNDTKPLHMSIVVGYVVLGDFDQYNLNRALILSAFKTRHFWGAVDATTSRRDQDSDLPLFTNCTNHGGRVLKADIGL